MYIGIHIPLTLQNRDISQVCFEAPSFSPGKTSDLLLAGQLSVSVELAGGDLGHIKFLNQLIKFQSQYIYIYIYIN